MIRAALVDDNDQDLKIAGRLTQVGLPCDPIKPGPNADELRTKLASDLQKKKYNVVILDYRLDDSTPSISYRGRTVAASLKDRFPSIPIVLLTTEQKLQRWVEHNPNVRDLFDLQILKNRLSSRAGRVEAAQGIRDLAIGYQRIARAIERAPGASPWSTAAKTMG